MRRSLQMVAHTVIVLVVTANSVTAQARHDGNTWLALSRELKVSYVQGMIDGSALGVMLAKENVTNGDPCGSKFMPAYSKAAENLLAEVSPAQIVDGMDATFKDYRNRSLLMTDAAYVTLRAISGTPPEDIEKLLQAVRAAPK